MLNAPPGTLSQHKGQSRHRASRMDLTPDRISPRPDQLSSCPAGEAPAGLRIPPRNGTHGSVSGWELTSRDFSIVSTAHVMSTFIPLGWAEEHASASPLWFPLGPTPDQWWFLSEGRDTTHGDTLWVTLRILVSLVNHSSCLAQKSV